MIHRKRLRLLAVEGAELRVGEVHRSSSSASPRLFGRYLE
jgi:hypothetical protein